MNTELIKKLFEARELYHNGTESFWSDVEYDYHEELLRQHNPTHEFFFGIGSEVRRDKVKLPYEMGSLDQLYDNDCEKWIVDKGLSQSNMVISSKMDGVSALIIYDGDGELQIAYSRGDGIEGQDITRHVKRIPTLPTNINTNVTIRSECIISKSNFKKFLVECEQRNYRTYKNPRNAVAGLINAKENPEWVYKYLDIITYELIDAKIDKLEELSKLYEYGFKVVRYFDTIASKLNDSVLRNMIGHLQTESVLSDYEQDGVVIDINSYDERIQQIKTSSSLNPPYTKKFKMLNADNIKTVRVVDVIWDVSKNGLLKPRIQIEPVDINGVTITYLTAFNAKYILDNRINIGSEVSITRSGDVIPHILSVVKSSPVAHTPSTDEFGAYSLNETGVDFELEAANDRVFIKQLVSFFDSLNIPNLKEASVSKLYSAGYDSIEQIVNLDIVEFNRILGKNGIKAHDGIHERFENVYEYDFVGSLPYFVGVGKTIFERIYDQFGTCRGLTINQLISVNGIEEKTAHKIIDNYPKLESLMDEIQLEFISKPEHNGNLNDKTFLFTGVRDKSMEQRIVENGGKIVKSVNKELSYLIAKDVNGTSSKLKKARDLGIDVVSIQELTTILG